ncbi:MAG: HlyD family efflux transporter periplasmic adaptor subunit [Ruminococcus flavefaciens]|nr:HlyD family efflux transporter periplasmic adaptor subunit [Ruminococcus flavefaciens]
MEHWTARSHRIKIVAAVCAMVIIAGGTAGVYAVHSKTHARTASEESSITAEKNDDSTLNAGGTVTSAQLNDSLGLKNTSVQLTVESVLAEAGDSVTAGTKLYKLTDESLAKALKVLNSELRTAENALTEQKSSYQVDLSKAKLLYESELLLGRTAQSEYEAGLKELDDSLQKAYDSYQEALNTINNTPAEISAKQSELKNAQTTAEKLETEKASLQSKFSEAEKVYSSAVGSYNSLAAEYNASAGTVRYLGNALGKDVSSVSLVQTVTANLIEQKETPEMPGKNGAERPDASKEASVPVSFDIPQETAVSSNERSFNKLAETTVSASGDLVKLYDSALAEYNSQKEKLTNAENSMKSAENNYKSLSQQLSECSASLSKAQSNVSSLEKDISSLNSSLSKAQSNLSKLMSEYNSLKASYDTDKLKLQNTLDTNMATYENAEYHYKITCSTLEDELAQAQDARDTAAENLTIFEENLSGGYILAQQDGVIYSMNCQEGRNVNVNSPVVSYVDDSTFAVTVELDQNDVTEVSIGDSVIIYSSESGIANGRITAIAAGESKSLADVRFNVTVTADDGAKLYSGQSVNVYFNSDSTNMGGFTDFKGSSSEKGGMSFGGGERPDFSGGMPEGFDPSNMPDFSGRKGN